MGEESRVGEVLAGKYRLDEELGRGGMGSVYRAFHLGVHRSFAVKLLNVDLAARKAVAERFLREAQAAGRIGHPAILEVFDVGEDASGQPFMVMELLDGEPLAELVARGALAPDVACWISVKLLEALEAAHAAGVIHRDVKPQNVFLVGRAAGPRTVKLLDFGIAKFLEGEGASITRSGEIIGSPLYMAPEQALGETAIDARADVWSVGAMLFQMLTGRAAHEAQSAVGVLARILTEPAPAPSSRRESVPPELDAIVLKALSIPREERYGSAKEMREALAGFLAARGTTTPPSFPALTSRGGTVVRRDPDASGDDATAAAAARAMGSTSAAMTTATSVEPGASAPAEASVVGTSSGARSRRTVIVVAAAALLVGAVMVPWLVPSRRDAGLATADAAVEATASASAASAKPDAQALANANADEDASVLAAAPAVRDAGTTAPAAPRAGCPTGEILSLGHCCPRGMVWQAGRCERPLATTF